jgi:hypothetical protein
MTNTRSSRIRSISRTFPAFAATGVLALGLTACGSDSNDDNSTAAAATTTAQAAPKPAAEVKDVTGGTTAVTLDADFVKALGTLKLTPAPVGDAKVSKAGVATFPITSGNVKYYTPGTVSPFVQGMLDHDGSGLSLTAKGGPKVALKDFKIDPGASVLTGSVSVDGKQAAASAPLFFLDGRTLKPLASEGSDAVLEGTTVKLKQEAADLLNTTFKTDALKGGLVIGIAKITVPTGA